MEKEYLRKQIQEVKKLLMKAHSSLWELESYIQADKE